MAVSEMVMHTLWHHRARNMVEHGAINQRWRRRRRHHAMGPDKARLHAILGAAILG